jgi:hypothetical protein
MSAVRQELAGPDHISQENFTTTDVAYPFPAIARVEQEQRAITERNYTLGKSIGRSVLQGLPDLYAALDHTAGNRLAHEALYEGFAYPTTLILTGLTGEVQLQPLQQQLLTQQRGRTFNFTSQLYDLHTRIAQREHEDTVISIDPAQQADIYTRYFPIQVPEKPDDRSFI